MHLSFIAIASVLTKSGISIAWFIHSSNVYPKLPGFHDRLYIFHPHFVLSHLLKISLFVLTGWNYFLIKLMKFAQFTLFNFIIFNKRSKMLEELNQMNSSRAPAWRWKLVLSIICIKLHTHLYLLWIQKWQYWNQVGE